MAVAAATVEALDFQATGELIVIFKFTSLSQIECSKCSSAMLENIYAFTLGCGVGDSGDVKGLYSAGGACAVQMQHQSSAPSF